MKITKKYFPPTGIHSYESMWASSEEDTPEPFAPEVLPTPADALPSDVAPDDQPPAAEPPPNPSPADASATPEES